MTYQITWTNYGSFAVLYSDELGALRPTVDFEDFEIELEVEQLEVYENNTITLHFAAHVKGGAYYDWFSVDIAFGVADTGADGGFICSIVAQPYREVDEPDRILDKVGYGNGLFHSDPMWETLEERRKEAGKEIYKLIIEAAEAFIPPVLAACAVFFHSKLSA